MWLRDHLGLHDLCASQAMRMRVLLPSGALQLLKQPQLVTSSLGHGAIRLTTIKLMRPHHSAPSGWALQPLEQCALSSGGGIYWEAAAVAAAHHHLRSDAWDSATGLHTVCLD